MTPLGLAIAGMWVLGLCLGTLPRRISPTSLSRQVDAKEKFRWPVDVADYLAYITCEWDTAQHGYSRKKPNMTP